MVEDTDDDVSAADDAIIVAWDGLAINTEGWRNLLREALWLLNNPTDWPGGQNTDRLEKAVKALIPGWKPNFE